MSKVAAYINKEDGLVCAKCYKPFTEMLTDEEILKTWRETPINEYNSTQQRVCDFAKAILRKAQE